MNINKTVLIVGGAGLLGSAFTQGLAQAGTHVIVADISDHKMQALRGQLTPQALARVQFLTCDVSDPDSVTALMETCFSTYPPIDAVINCAYPRTPEYGKRFEDVEFKGFCDNLTLLAGTTFLVSQAAAKKFKTQGFGHIIHIASIYGVVAPKFDIYDNTPMTMPVEYAFGKAGIVHFTKYLASYLKNTGIRVNCISLGGLLDGQPEAFLQAYQRHCLSKGILNPDDVVGTVRFLVSDDSRFINGQNIVVDDGFVL